jgi:hypothetical protein
MIDLPAECLIHNSHLGFKGTEGLLLQISDSGFFLVSCKFGDAPHRVLLPIQNTVIILERPEEVIVDAVEVER